MNVANVLSGATRWHVELGDCIPWLNSLPADCADLILGSPPYMDARTYSRDDVSRGCQEWVDWMLDVTEQAVRVSCGLVLWVVAGVQRDLCYWPGCEGLAWEWWRRGRHLWRPCIWWKVDENECGSGISGSGGKQWLRNDWEYVLAFKREGWLPWADPLVMGHEPAVSHLGGEMSNRNADGRRINDRAGDKKRRQAEWAYGGPAKGVMPPGPVHDAEGNIQRADGRPFPKIVNPGNCIVVKARVGGGHMGDRLCSENEAPYPENLAAFFIRSFCPPGGVVLDCFSGSGTTGAVAVRWGRRFLDCDLRESQVELSRRRISNVTPDLFEGERENA